MQPTCCRAVVFASIELALFASFVHADNIVAKIRAAAAAAKSQLKSAEGSGVFSVYNGDDALVAHARFTVKMERPRYRLRLEYDLYEHPALSYPRRDILCDGSSIFGTLYSERIIPVGCETRVYDNIPGEINRASKGFRWDPSKLQDEMLDLEMILEKFDVVVTEGPDGSVVGSYEAAEMSPGEFTALPRDGFNVSKFVVLNKRHEAEGGTHFDYSATWEKQDGVWFVSRMEWLWWIKGKQYRRFELAYDTFRVNPTIDANEFTLKGLNPCEGSRILDQRKDSPIRVYHASQQATEARKLESITEELESLAVRNADPAPKVSETPSRWRWFFIGLNIIVVVGVFVVISRLRRRQRPPS